jgi:hypothetical protein
MAGNARKPFQMSRKRLEIISKQRLALHLFQIDVAKLISVHKVSIQNWERNVGTPLPGQLPAIIRFLGYVPFVHDDTVGGNIRWLRTCAGWTK